MKIWYNTSKFFEQLLSSQLFGNLKKISINEGGIVGKTNRGTETYQANKKLSGGGVILESACHTLSVLSYIFESISIEKADVIFEGNLDVEANVIFKVKNKIEFPIEYKITLINPIEVETILYFENCYIKFNQTVPTSNFIVYNYDKKKIFEIKNDIKFAESSQQAYFLTWQSFIEKLKSGEKIDIEKSTSIKTTELISKIFEIGQQK